MVHDLAMLDGGGNTSFSKDTTATWKPWELRRLNDAKASVQLALAGACLLIGRVDTAKRLTLSVSSDTFGGGSGGGDSTFPPHQKPSVPDGQPQLERTDIAVQNSVLYYLIRDGKVKEALTILQASRML